MALAKELPHAPQWSWLHFRCQLSIVRQLRGATLATADRAANPQPIQCQPDRSHKVASDTRAIVAIVLLTVGWLAHLKRLNPSSPPRPPSESFPPSEPFTYDRILRYPHCHPHRVTIIFPSRHPFTVSSPINNYNGTQEVRQQSPCQRWRWQEHQKCYQEAYYHPELHQRRLQVCTSLQS
jgi:hypothetical protein